MFSLIVRLVFFSLKIDTKYLYGKNQYFTKKQKLNYTVNCMVGN